MFTITKEQLERIKGKENLKLVTVIIILNALEMTKKMSSYAKPALAPK